MIKLLSKIAHIELGNDVLDIGGKVADFVGNKIHELQNFNENSELARGFMKFILSKLTFSFGGEKKLLKNNPKLKQYCKKNDEKLLKLLFQLQEEGLILLWNMFFLVNPGLRR